MKLFLKNIIDSQDTKSGKLFDFFIQFLIILSLISFSLDTIPDLDTQLVYFLNLFEVVSIIIFTFEFSEYRYLACFSNFLSTTR